MTRLLVITCAALCLLCPLARADQADPGVAWVPGSTAVIDQLTGETIQIWRDGRRTDAPTASACLSRADAYGADLGVPVSFPGKILFLFGDTWPCLADFAGAYHPQIGWGQVDSVGYLETPVDLSRWPLLTQGRLGESAPPPRPAMRLFLAPAPTAGEPRMWPTTIDGLQPGQTLGSYEVPTGAFALDDHLYAFYNVRHQEGLDGAGETAVFFLNAILARSETPSSNWSQNAPPTMRWLYDVSIHPPVSDPALPPSDTDAPGKFIHVAPVVIDHDTLVSVGIAPRLPIELRSAARVLLVWGSSWRYVHSDCYLAAVDAAHVDDALDGRADPTRWWYCTGTDSAPTWSHDESAAAPLIDGWTAGVGPSIGEHSVAWNATLRRFILSYQERYAAIQFRTASMPWGPWSPPTTVFGLGDPTSLGFIHHVAADPIVSFPIPVIDAAGVPLPEPPSGATYGPYLLDRSTANADGSVTLYFTMSTWRPYQVFLMSTNFILVRDAHSGTGGAAGSSGGTGAMGPAPAPDAGRTSGNAGGSCGLGSLLSLAMATMTAARASRWLMSSSEPGEVSEPMLPY